MSAKILLADDEAALWRAVEYALRREGHEVRTVSDGAAALAEASASDYDLAILDVMMPRTSGLEACRELRASGGLPIILLTARDGEADVIIGLEAGADDYVTKPFSVAELVSRVNAILRRRRLDAAEVSTPTVSHGGLRLDLAGRSVEVEGVPARLTPSEFDLLYLLASSPGQVFSRRAIMEHLWKGTYFGDGRTVDTHVASIRRKIERDPTRPTRLLTSHGHGYKLSRDVERVR